MLVLALTYRKVELRHRQAARIGAALGALGCFLGTVGASAGSSYIVCSPVLSQQFWTDQSQPCERLSPTRIAIVFGLLSVSIAISTYGYFTAREIQLSDRP